MDKLYIRDLEIFANHGVFEEEKRLGQKFLLSLTLDLNLYPAAVEEDLEQSVNYGLLCHEVEAFFKERSYDLIETAAEKTAAFILNRYPQVHGVTVLLKKPWAPIGRPLETAAIEINRSWHRAFVAFGSNMGDSLAIIRHALEQLKHLPGIKAIQESSIIETEPWGYTDQDKFLNGVIEINTWLPPESLLAALLDLENQAARKRTIKWGPRTLDLDLLFYDDLVCDSPFLTLPHPLIPQRDFVLRPMVEIAPWFVHPVRHQTMTELLERLEAGLH